MNTNVYVLMHKDDTVALLQLSNDKSHIDGVKLITPELAPFFGKFDIQNANFWWQNRPISKTRKDIKAILAKEHCLSISDYMIQNNALSLTDCYWTKALNEEHNWNDVKLYDKITNKSVIIASQNLVKASATLSGEMQKKWISQDDKLYLQKMSSIMFGQQNVNELIAMSLHAKQGTSIPYVHYKMIQENNICIGSKCPAFTSEDIEIVSAYEVLLSKKQPTSLSKYQAFVENCKNLGLDETYVDDYLSYLLQTDFILDNTDRHLMNIALLRNSNTGKIISFSPIYDTGNCMYLDKNCIMNRYEHLTREISSFATNFHNSIKNQKNRDIINYDKILINFFSLFLIKFINGFIY